MASRVLNKLTAAAVQKKRKPGMYGDGGGLWLQVSPAGTKSWVFRFSLHHKAREMGLGSLRDVSLAEARSKAAEQRKALLAGVDPIEARDSETARKRLAAASATSFAECARAYIAANQSAWRNAKHLAQWTSSLSIHVYPVFGDMPVQDIDVNLVQKALAPIWSTKTETASRLRGRIETVLDYASTLGMRTGENPARWKGHLDKVFPKPSKVKVLQHHAALPYQDIPVFMSSLRVMEGVAPRALELAILTASRTTEVLGATLDEFDLDAATWTVPADRMKAKREHRIPLSPNAIALARPALEHKAGGFLFSGAAARRRLSDSSMVAVLRRMKREDLTVHGFRSTFRDWAAEQTNFPREVAEAALAHTISDKTEAAYRRGDLFMKRRKLMEAWAAYCEAAIGGGKVLQMRKQPAP